MSRLPRPGFTPLAAAALLALSLTACGGGGGSSTPATPPAASELTLSATGSSATAGGSGVTLTAGLNGTGTINWTLAAGNPGTLSASSGTSVVYTPPALGSLSAAATVTVTATSGSLSKAITLQVAPGESAGLTLLAGTISSNGGSSVDGKGAAARFNFISATAVDSNGVLYVADNVSLRKISADGSVSTVTGITGAADGNLNALGVNNINQLTLLADGTLYFSEYTNVFITSHTYGYTTRFRKLTPDGTLTTLASVPAQTLSLKLAAGADGALYTYDPCAIYTLDSAGKQTLLAGGTCALAQAGIDGTGTAAQFATLQGVRVAADGTLYAYDYSGLRKITKSGVVTTLAGASNTTGLTLDAQGAPLLLSNSGAPSSYQISKYSNGALTPLYTVGTVGDVYRQGALQLQAMPDGSVITSDGKGVSRIGSDGKATLLAGLRDDSQDVSVNAKGELARFVKPGLLAADKSGNIYSVENVGNYTASETIRKTTPDGTVSTVIDGQLGVIVTGMVVTPANALVVSVRNADNSYGGAIYQIGSDGAITLIAGVPGGYSTPQQVDGQGANARFGQPTLAGVDSAGNLYAYDLTTSGSQATSIRQITSLGAVSTIASLPAGLGAAPDGNTYQLVDGKAVYRVTPAGVRTLVAGDENGVNAILPGALPAQLYQAGSIVALDARHFAIAAGNGIYKLVLP
ncbi:hypothetical protein GJ699_32980 [Duganella sp. FT80W]|uniref:Uncharacterized protein n=1 Tax=Duganella guangzhouensis TaxID=2666084 RepID=A0A6I2LAF5_9BURK|nr:hypothetical protein [Duganella guangzhouensis]MRW94790.1 hypothetical protein [Duganella guangzhouensis]